MRMLNVVTVVILAAASAGCGANWNSIFRQRSVSAGGVEPSAEIVTMDARQRAILSTYQIGRPQATRFCAEPLPDVFTAISASLAAEAAVTPAAEGTGVTAALAAAIKESASTISRSQTVNLLAQSMYRTCERYMSGAITETDFIIQTI